MTELLQAWLVAQGGSRGGSASQTREWAREFKAARKIYWKYMIS